MESENKKSIPFFATLGKAFSGSSEYDSAILTIRHAEETDAELVAAFLAGSEECFAVLLERHLPMAYKFAYRYVGNADDASDVAQESFIKAWKYLKRFDTKRSFKTWILAITKNTALDFLKKKKALLFSRIEEGNSDLDAFLAPYAESGDAPEDVLEKKQSKAVLDGALAELTPAYRKVLSMRYNDHLKFREIAEILREPIDTVKSKHRRAVAILEKMLKDAREDLAF